MANIASSSEAFLKDASSCQCEERPELRCSHLLCGGGHDALLKTVRLLLNIFTSFMVPEQVVLHLGEKKKETSPSIRYL